MNRSLALLLLSIVSSACAGASRSAAPSAGAATAVSPAATSSAVATDEPRSKVICRMERPLGSNIARPICRTQEEIDGERQATQDAMHLAPRSGRSPKGN